MKFIHKVVDGLVTILCFIPIILFFVFMFMGPVAFCQMAGNGIVFVQDLSLDNPTYGELCSFVASDHTDSNKYSWSNYNCEDFSEDVILNSRAKGYRAGFVFIECHDVTPRYDGTVIITSYGGDTTRHGHAIVCFETSDKGLYFLEPQLDVLFSESEMKSMISSGLYDISIPDGEYFLLDFDSSDYDIEWYRFILE